MRGGGRTVGKPDKQNADYRLKEVKPIKFKLLLGAAVSLAVAVWLIAELLDRIDRGIDEEHG